MSGRHDLPSGAWVELRDPAAITERQRRAVRLVLTRLKPDTVKLLSDAAPPTDPTDQVSLLAYAEHQGRLAAAMGEDLPLMFELNDVVASQIVTKASFLEGDARCTADDVGDLVGADYDALLALAAPFLPYFMGVDFETRDADRSTPTLPSSA